MFHFFPYRKYPRQRTNGTLVDELRPTVDFTMSLGDVAWSTEALIDTGSPLTLVTHEVGEALGVQYLRPGADHDSVSMLGKTNAVQRETVRITLDRFGHNLAWETDVWFFHQSWDMQLHVGAIFGTAGFLDQWAVTFVRPKEYFVVEELASFELRIPPDTGNLIELPDDDQDWWRTGN